MIKIATINTLDKGGAGIAALRLHENLNLDKSIQSNFFQADPHGFNKNKNINIRQVYPNKFKRRLKKIGIDTNPDLLFKKEISKYAQDYEIVTSSLTNYRVEQHQGVLEANIIHLHWIADFINYPTFFKGVKSKPIVWTLHDMNPFQGIFHYKDDELRNSKVLGAFNRKMVEVKKRSLKYHKNIHIVCYAKWMYEASKNSELFNSFHHHFIPQGVDFTEFKIWDNIEEKKKLHLDNDKKTLLFLSQNLDNHRKGGDLLVHALNLIKNKNFNLITIGHRTAKLVVPPEINHIHIDHTASVEDLYKYYAISDLTILPSREDNLPNVLIESLANGTPLLSFKIGGMLDHIHENYTGLLAENLSAESLASKIDDFLTRTLEFDSSEIREYAKKNFSHHEQSKKYIDLYKSLL